MKSNGSGALAGLVFNLCSIGYTFAFHIPALQLVVPSRLHTTRQSNHQIRMSGKAVKRVAIVGAGSGGLALANALKILPTGVEEIKVFDQYARIQPEIGGGVQINGGAVMLAKLGLGDAIQQFGVPVKRVLSRSTDREVLLDLDVEKEVRADTKLKDILIRKDKMMVLLIMRDCLLKLLADNLPRGVIQHNKKVKAVVPGGEGSQKCLQFEDGTTSTPFDLIVGADGIKSAVRSAVVKSKEGDTAAIPSGIRIYFGVGPSGKRPPGTESEVFQWLGLNQYALSASYGGLKGKKYDMIAAVFRETALPSSEGQDTSSSSSSPSSTSTVTSSSSSKLVKSSNEAADDGNEAWQQAASPVEVKRRLIDNLQRTNFPEEVIAQAQACTRFFNIGVSYRNPLGAWRSDDASVVLIGDAAHAMPPFLGQGVNQAVQDAYCLAERLVMLKEGRLTSIDEALKSYVAVRKPAVALLLAQSVFLGTVETAPGLFGAFARNTFFNITGKLGVAKKVFLEGCTPKV